MPGHAGRNGHPAMPVAKMTFPAVSVVVSVSTTQPVRCLTRSTVVPKRGTIR
jgi:hypothetical protein